MELQDKAKEKFDSWYIPWIREQRNDYSKYSNDQIIRKFHRKIPSEKYGVFVDFFETVGIYIVITGDGFGEFGWEIDTFEETISSDMWLRTRNKTRYESIDKACEIFTKLIK